MAASKKPTHVVRHKRLYLAVNGVLKHIPKGSELALTPKQAKGLGRRVAKIGKALELGTIDETAEKSTGEDGDKTGDETPAK